MTRGTELRLILRARGGDELALQRLLRRYGGLINSMVSDYFVKGGDRQDLWQEARIGAWKAVRDYNPPNPFASFLGLCVRRQLITAVKTADRGKHSALNNSVRVVERSDDFEDALPLLGVDHRDPSAVLEQRAEIEEIGTAIRERLTDCEYVCLLGLLNDESYEDIAEGYGYTVKQVDNAVQRARLKLSEEPAWRKGYVAGYSCPGCGRATVKRRGRGRPPRCVVCRTRPRAAA